VVQKEETMLQKKRFDGEATSEGRGKEGDVFSTKFGRGAAVPSHWKGLEVRVLSLGVTGD